jgi:hypothetical protein
MDHNINEDYAKYDLLGPKDCRQAAEGEKIICSIGVQKPISADGEIMTLQIPIFQMDSKEDVDQRVAVLLAPLQKRMYAMNMAMLAQEKAQIEHNQQIEKEKVEHQAEIKRIAMAAKKKGK